MSAANSGGGPDGATVRALRFLDDTPSWEGITEQSAVAGRRRLHRGRAPKAFDAESNASRRPARARRPADFDDDPLL